MSNTALQRITQAILTNKSGGAVALGDVVVIDGTTAASFTTTTTSGFVNGVVGVVLEPNGIASNATGMVAFAGPVPQINLSGSASLGDLFKTHTVAKQAVRHAAGIVAGDFGIVLGTGTTPAALLWGLPAGATGAGSGDFSGPGSAVANNLVGFNGTGGKTGQDSGMSLDGWITAGETWTYASADGPTGVFTVAGVDLTGKYQAGMRIKLTQTTVKYFIITKVTFSTDTTISVYGGTDYTLANAAISANYYSTAKAPFGFNTSPAKWTETVTDSTVRSQGSPVNGTWYNLGSVSISIPIGVWRVEYFVAIQVDGSASSQAATTLSTANNTGSDAELECYQYEASASNRMYNMTRSKLLTLAAKTSYYLNTLAGSTGINNLYNRNDLTPVYVRAICALL